MTTKSIHAQIASLITEMNGLRRANGTLPSLASKDGKRFAELEFALDKIKHALNKVVNLDGKQYTVRTLQDGSIEIFTQWEGFDISQRNFVNQPSIPRSAHISPNGRIGRKVLAAIDAAQPRPLRERLCTLVDIETAAQLLAADK
jgi:hypothetical protein